VGEFSLRPGGREQARGIFRVAKPESRVAWCRGHDRRRDDPAWHGTKKSFVRLLPFVRSRTFKPVFLVPLPPENERAVIDLQQRRRFFFPAVFSAPEKSNFAKFVLFVSATNFSVNLAAPYFAVFMLQDLSFNYFLYAMVTIAAPLTLYLTVSRWGRHADKVGSLKVLLLTSKCFPLIPLLWIVDQTPWYLLMVEMFSGFLWAGFNLCAVNFIYDAASPQKRTRCIAYFNVVNGFALSCGALLGGFMVRHLPPLFGHKILALFFISAMLRLAVSWALPRMLKEVRHVEHIKSLDLFFSMIRLRSIPGIDRGSLRDVRA